MNDSSQEPIEVDEIILPGQPDPTRRPEPGSVKNPTDLLQRSLPKHIARLLDTCFTIPGTKVRIGLDPIIGFFFPVVGDAISAVMGATIVREALRRGIPRPIVIRMGANIAINAAVGSIPMLGDVFSVWFKSNAQNYALLLKHTVDPDYPLEKVRLWPIFAVLGIAFFLIFLVLLGVYSLIQLIT